MFQIKKKGGKDGKLITNQYRHHEIQNLRVFHIRVG